MGLPRQTYLKEWKRVRGYYGQEGQAAPALHIMRTPADVPPALLGASGGAMPTPGGRPEIYMAVKSLKRLGRHDTRYERNTIDHELAHVFQRPDLWNEGNAQVQERGAYRLAKAISRENPQKRKRAYKHLSPWIKRGQFGL